MTVPNSIRATERWAPAPGFEGHYLISSEGRIRSLKRRTHDGDPLYVNWKTDRYGYAAVDLWLNGRPKRRRVHVLVAAAFIGPRLEGQEVRHLDGNGLNPALSNLAYGTRSENSRDKRAHGTDHNAAKTHCPQGHPYDETNTKREHGRRYCRACQQARSPRLVTGRSGRRE